MLKRWRRLDGPGLEVLSLIEDAGGMTARSVIIDGGDKAFGMTAEWRLDRNWRSRSLVLQVIDAKTPPGGRSGGERETQSTDRRARPARLSRR